MRNFLLTVIGIICMLPISGQTKFLNFHQLTVEEGLSESTNQFLYMDKDAFTWIGSLDGLNVYDGKEVKVYKNNMHSFKGIDVQSSFFEDKNGDIWFATGEAINCYRRDKEVFIDTISNEVYFSSHFYLVEDYYDIKDLSSDKPIPVYFKQLAYNHFSSFTCALEPFEEIKIDVQLKKLHKKIFCLNYDAEHQVSIDDEELGKISFRRGSFDMVDKPIDMRGINLFARRGYRKYRGR